MPESSNVGKAIRDRLPANTEDRLGKALSDLLESPLLTGAVGRAFDARERASQAQEVALGALNIPSAADIERLTRRLRSVSHRLEGIEDGVDRLDRALSPSGVEARLSAIEAQLRTLSERVEQLLLRAEPGADGEAGASTAPRAGATRAPARAPTGVGSRGAGAARAGAKPKAARKAAKSARRSGAARKSAG